MVRLILNVIIKERGENTVQRTVGFRVARGLLERPVYREFFATGLTVLDPIEGFANAAVPARLEVQNLIREIGDEAGLQDESFHEIEPGTPGANAEAKDVVGVDYSTNILAYSALSENGRAIRSQEMQKLLLSYRDIKRRQIRQSGQYKSNPPSTFVPGQSSF